MTECSCSGIDRADNELAKKKKKNQTRDELAELTKSLQRKSQEITKQTQQQILHHQNKAYKTGLR